MYTINPAIVNTNKTIDVDVRRDRIRAVLLKSQTAQRIDKIENIINGIETYAVRNDLASANVV